MSELLEFGGNRTAPEIPSKYLPALPYRQLPEPESLRKILGHSVILLAAAIGSGEYVLWPYITSQVGLVAMWMAIVGVGTQFFINMEIERYTLATGETAITGFTRLWKPWGIAFMVMAIFSWAWPGWASGASTALTFVLGTGTDAVPYMTIAALVAIGLALTASPVVYQTVEKMQSLFVAVILVFLVFAVILGITAEAWVDLGKGFASFGRIPAEIPVATLLGALAFAGAGGTLNLVQSNWIRDKGMAMGVYAPKIVSPLTGKEEAAAGTGFLFPQDEDNLRRWGGWWKVANREHFWTFGFIGGISIVLLSLLTYSTLQGEEVANDFTFIQREGEVLQEVVAPWFGTFFWLTGVVVLLSTNLGVLDHVGRLSADVLRVGFLRDNEKWTESKIYFVVIWAEIVFGSIILLSGVTQPLVLLVIAACLNGIVMFIYSMLLIKLNRFVLPKPIQMRNGRLAAMGWAVLFFGFFSVIVVVDQAGKLF
ncbi:hypothetical protein BH20ACT5_BH20ACT5_25240 [soil metagenome]